MVDFTDGEPPTEPDSNWVPLRRFDPKTLKLRFSDPQHTCLTCRDMGFIWVPTAGTYKFLDKHHHAGGYQPCGHCVRGNKIFTGWWAEAREWRDNRPAQPDANQLLPPSEEDDVAF